MSYIKHKIFDGRVVKFVLKLPSMTVSQHHEAERNETASFSPLYRQIKRLMIQALELSEWRPGESIPSESELAQRFRVSQGTVRKAIDELVTDNLLLRRQGKGTFVASHDDPRSQFRFLRLVPDDVNSAALPVEPQSEFLECMRARAGAETARALGLAASAPIVAIRRLLRFAGKPVVLEEIYVPGERFDGLDLAMLKGYQGSLYSLFETRFGVRMLRAEERLRAVTAERASAQLLDVPEGTPLLSVERVAYTFGDKPVEWRRGLYSTAAHHYRNELG